MRYCVIVVCLFLVSFAYGQTMNGEVPIHQLFDDVVFQVESHYSGIADKLTPETQQTYNEFKSSLKSRVSDTNYLDCIASYLAWFKDKHLYAINDGTRLTAYEDQPIDYSDSLLYAPKYVAKKIDKDCFLIRIPSLKGKNPTYCQFVKAANKYRLSKCPYLIIDLRGNTGGSDGLYRPLQKLAYDHEGIIEGLDLRNTEENVSYFTKRMKKDPFWQKILKQSESSQSDFFCLFEQQTISYRHVKKRPAKVAIIIDNQVASSAEQMILDMKSCSDRIVLYGKDSTMGCLDYANPRPYHIDSLNLVIMIPMTRSRRLPNHPVDPHGIAPERVIPLSLPKELTDNLDEWTRWVADNIVQFSQGE